MDYPAGRSTDSLPPPAEPSRSAGPSPPAAEELERTDPTFPADYLASEASVEAVARAFRHVGFDTWLPPVRLRPTVAERAAYRDHGDCFVRRPGAPTWRRVEVKWRLYRFADVASYPTPLAIVDTRWLFDTATPVPWAYVFVSADLAVALLLPVRRTRADWTTRRWRNRRLGRVQEVYECPTGLTRRMALPPVARRAVG